MTDLYRFNPLLVLLFWLWPCSTQWLKEFNIHSVETAGEVSQELNMKIHTYLKQKARSKVKRNKKHSSLPDFYTPAAFKISLVKNFFMLIIVLLTSLSRQKLKQKTFSIRFSKVPSITIQIENPKTLEKRRDSQNSTLQHQRTPS